MGCWQCLSFSVVQLKCKHCQKTHCRNGVVYTFGHYRQRDRNIVHVKIKKNRLWSLHCTLENSCQIFLVLLPRGLFLTETTRFQFFSQSQKQKNFLNDQKITFELQITTLKHYYSRVTEMCYTASSLHSQFVMLQQNGKTNIHLPLSFFSVINGKKSGLKSKFYILTEHNGIRRLEFSNLIHLYYSIFQPIINHNGFSNRQGKIMLKTEGPTNNILME